MTEIVLLTVEQACTYLAVSRSTLYRWVERGLLAPTLRVGLAQRPRFSITDLDAIYDALSLDQRIPAVTAEG